MGPLPGALAPLRRLPRAYVWPVLVLAGLVYPWVVVPGRWAFVLTAFAVAGILAGALARGAEQTNLIAHQRDFLVQYEAELDEADALRALVEALCSTKRRSPAESDAIRTLRAHIMARRATAAKVLRDADIDAGRPVRPLAEYVAEVAA